MRQEDESIRQPRQTVIRSIWPLILLLLLLAAAELLTRATVESTRLDRILDLVERDPVLLWRLRAGLNTIFENARVRTSEHHLRGPAFDVQPPPGTWRIVCLGASPTFGWGVEEAATYPTLLGDRLRAQGIPVETINGGVPGYTSWQGRGFLPQVLSWSPAAVTIAYDLNDLDIYRFFVNDGRPDSAHTPESETRIAAQNLLDRSRLYTFARRNLIEMLSHRGGPFHASRMPRRVSQPEYCANLLAIERECRAHDVAVVFIKMPVHLPFSRLASRDAATAARESSLGNEAVGRSDWPAAMAHYENAYEADPTRLDVYDKLADALRRVGQTERARRIDGLIAFAAAFSDQAHRQYNATVEEVARATGRPCLDIVAAFTEDGRGEGLWNSREDPFHPNAAGHAVIAALLEQTLAPLWAKEP